MSPFWSGALGALAVLAVARAVRLATWRRRWRGSRRGAFVVRRLSARLGLAPEQEQVLRAEADALAAELHAVRGEARALRSEVAELLASPALDVTAAAAALARPFAKVEAARARGAEALARVHAMLRPEQRAALAALVKDGPHRFGHRRHGHA